MDNASIGYFKDFLQQYIKISDACFSHCINALGERSLLDEEKKCLDACVIKHIRVNHKVQSVYLELQPMIINKRVEEFQKAQALSEQAQMQQNQASPETPATSQPVTAQS